MKKAITIILIVLLAVLPVCNSLGELYGQLNEARFEMYQSFLRACDWEVIEKTGYPSDFSFIWSSSSTDSECQLFLADNEIYLCYVYNSKLISGRILLSEDCKRMMLFSSEGTALLKPITD